MNFFFYRCVPIKLCDIVKAAEGTRQTIAYHDDHFPKETADTVWVRAVGKWAKPPVVISGDSRILVRPDEANALKEQNLTFFCLEKGWMQTDFWEVAWRFLKVWPEIVQIANRTSQPEIFKVSFGKSLKIEPYSVTKNLRQR